MRYDHLNMLPERAFRKVGKKLLSLEGGGKQSAPPPPDYSGLAKANDNSALYAKQAAEDDLAFRKQQYEEAKPYLKTAQDTSTAATQQQMAIANENQQNARDQTAFYKNTFQPVETQTAMDSVGAQYLNPAQQAQLRTAFANGDSATIQQLTNTATENSAQQAMGQVQASGGNAVAEQQRGLLRLGGDPNRMADYATQIATNQTATEAGAANQARTNANNGGIALRSGVANFGRNMPNTAGQAYGLSTQASATGVNSATTGANAGLPMGQYVSGGYAGKANAANGAIQANLGLAGVQNQGYGIQSGNVNANNAGFGQMVGTGIGVAGAAMALSDRRSKYNIRLIGTREDGLNVYEFKYKPGFGAPRGAHIGVMADEVEPLYPHAVITRPDGYKAVNYAAL